MPYPPKINTMTGRLDEEEKVVGAHTLTFRQSSLCTFGTSGLLPVSMHPGPQLEASNVEP